jgi:hypothetical protein
VQSPHARSERRQVSAEPFASGLIGLATAWGFVAAGETLYGDLDGATDLAAIAAQGGRFSAGALLELIGAVLLAGGAAAAIIRLSATSPRLASLGGWITLASAASLGAFAMFHLVLLAMADDVAHRDG